jgi:hypothetical protein
MHVEGFYPREVAPGDRGEDRVLVIMVCNAWRSTGENV